MKYCVYKFLGEENEVLYIGKTKRIKTRLEEEHFTLNGHLDEDVYFETEKVLVAELKSYEAMGIYERYLINVEGPKYNVRMNNYTDFEFELPELKWVEVEIDKEKIVVQKWRKLNKAAETKEENVYSLGILSKEEIDIETLEVINERGYRVVKVDNAPIYGLGLRRRKEWPVNEIPYCRAINVNGERYFNITDIEKVIHGRGCVYDVTIRLIKRELIETGDILVLEDSTLRERKHVVGGSPLRFGNERWLAKRVLEQVKLNRRRHTGWTPELGYLAKLIESKQISVQ